jgi:hypothetical protein
MAAGMDFDFEDMERFEKTLKAMGGLPPKIAVKAAGKGANLVRKSARANAPEYSGTLKRAIRREGERVRVKGKKVYDIQIDASLNQVFQKPIKNPGEAGGKSKKAYYPASQEYGFLTRSKGGGLSYVPGYHYLQNAIDDNAPAIKTTTIKTTMDELEKEWTKANGT